MQRFAAPEARTCPSGRCASSPRPLRRLFVYLALAGLAAVLPAAPTASASWMRAHRVRQRPSFDARRGSLLAPPSKRELDEQRRFQRGLGTRARLIRGPDGLNVTTLSGGLTSATRRDPIAIALGYVREHAQVFGLTQSDISALALVRSDTSWDGTTHLVWDRVVGGIRAADSDLRANVARDGRLLNVDARAQGAFEVSTRPNLSAGAALGVAARDVGAHGLPPRAFAPHGRDKRTRFSNGAQARLELLGMPRAGRLTWSVVLHGPGPYVYRDLVDAGSGQVLRRQNLTFAANNATVYERYPGAPLGGTAHTVDLSPWLENPAAPTRLRGNNAHVFSDPNDLCTAASCAGPGPGEDVGPSAGTNFDYPLQTVTDSTGLCPPAPGCTWDHNTANSWQTNRAQDATQAFYYVNEYHDHLKAPPIGFDEASGNFEFDNGSNGGAANDGLLVNTDDGANTNSGLPDASHQNNAFFTPGPDGTPGQMALYLQQPPTYSAVNIGDDADTIYHEYTHGLSNRLVTDPDGFGSLYYLQSAALGEGWSDWYAEDFLVSQGFVADHPGTSGEVTFDPYAPVRTQALDCAVGVSASICPGGATGHGGGYTLGDFERIRATGDPHADSEIWSETLWDLRTALGSATAERLVTDGMRLSPGQPSFLDMRDAILAADVAAFDGAHSATLWQVFAARGMGWKAVDLTARSIAAGDIVEDFSVPPPVRIRGVTNVQDPLPAGDRDRVPEPGENVRFDVPLTNPTATPITGVTATLGSTDPSVLIGQRSSPYPPLPGLGTATNSRRYTINIPSSATCGAPFPLRLDASTSAGSATGPFSLPTSGDGTINSPSASPAVAIPDASGAGATATLAVGPGLGRIRDLNGRIGSVTHPWDGDLRFRVQSPSGTVVRFVDRPGGATNNGADFTNTVVDDEATHRP